MAAPVSKVGRLLFNPPNPSLPKEGEGEFLGCGRPEGVWQ